MTKATKNIVKRYRITYLLWLDLHRRGNDYSMEFDRLKELSVIELVLKEDCGLSVEELAGIREKVLDEFYANLAK